MRSFVSAKRGTSLNDFWNVREIGTSRYTLRLSAKLGVLSVEEYEFSDKNDLIS